MNRRTMPATLNAECHRSADFADPLHYAHRHGVRDAEKNDQSNYQPHALNLFGNKATVLL